jgi:hypothetical protein
MLKSSSLDTGVDEWKKGNPSSEDIAEAKTIVKGGRA